MVHISYVIDIVKKLHIIEGPFKNQTHIVKKFIIELIGTSFFFIHKMKKFDFLHNCGSKIKKNRNTKFSSAN